VSKRGRRRTAVGAAAAPIAGRREWLMPAAVAAVTFVAFLPVLGAAFVNFDDDRMVIHNPYLRLPWPSALAWMWSTTYIGHYQPLAWMSLFLDEAIAGLRPFAYHLDSLAWHTAAAVALYVVLVELVARVPTVHGIPAGQRRAAAAAGALFWSVHPLRVESVAWIAERRDTISATFWLLAILAYLRSTAATGGARRRIYAASCALFAVSLLAKAWGMTFVVTLVALDWYPLQRRAWREKLPFAAIGAAAGLLAWVAQRQQPETMVGLFEWSVRSRILQAAYGLWFYVWKTIWPARLAAMYPLPLSVPTSFWLALAGVGAAAIGLLWRRRTHPALAAAALAYASTVAPVLGLAQSGPQLVADRYAYLSAMPFSALVAGALAVGARTASARTSRFGSRARGVVGVTVVVLAAFGVLTWRQAAVWHDSLTLWSHALETGHPSYVAYLDYGQALRARGDLAAATTSYQQAVALRPTSGNAWYNLANSLKALDRLDEAERAYQLAIQYSAWKVDAQVNLGNLYYYRRQYAAAIAQYRAATATLDRMPPEEFSPEPYLNLAIALSDAGDAAGARQALAVALRYPATRARAGRELRRLQASGAGSPSK
jgi:tetratricopeptide (TPR) repeat protein